ncbi:hypothetical protein BaRGS_00004675 [Batillaria attramentaria]|uniref:Uncharacterized protein n=1 Tax=Batillaria attramentaria TaxID=370345 RepID=A0ABD0LXT3_9CAEN
MSRVRENCLRCSLLGTEADVKQLFSESYGRHEAVDFLSSHSLVTLAIVFGFKFDDFNFKTTSLLVLLGSFVSLPTEVWVNCITHSTDRTQERVTECNHLCTDSKKYHQSQRKEARRNSLQETLESTDNASLVVHLLLYQEQSVTDGGHPSTTNASTKLCHDSQRQRSSSRATVHSACA